ncbi:MAG: hypothetical protein HYX55_04255 [Chloroflexi bacterium]|nr:hypothetical protein [Chloroflexota bacterium]
MLGTGTRFESSVGRAGRRAGTFLAVAIVVAACSNAGASTAPTTAANPTTAPATAAATTAAATGAPSTQAAAAPVKLELRTDAKYGSVVVGKGGLSLYVFTKDKGDGTSACYGNCAGRWPPLTVASASDVIPGSGVSGGLGTITRTDGALQVTLGGAPLYYFAGDTAAGDTKGQGLNSVWYLASPSGTPANGATPGATPGASKCTGPTCY